MNKENIKLSFIVPVYNVEKYIEKCVNSILNQSYSNIEIILVDDGSQDNSSKIIDKMSQANKKIKVIHKENSGVSSTRNIGLNNSSGDYILFIDADDYIEPTYAEYFVDLVTKYSCDMALSYDCYNIYSTNQNKNIFDDILDSEKIIEYIYIGKINVAVWNKIYKKEFLVKNNINFDENIWYGEGMLFNIKCLQYIDKVAVGNKKVYHQVYNTESAMRLFNIESNYCGIRSLEIQKENWKKINKKIINSWEYHRRNFNISIIIGIIKSNKKKEYKQEYVQCKKNLRRELLLPLKVSISIKRKIYELLFSIFPETMAKISIEREKNKAKKYE